MATIFLNYNMIIKNFLPTQIKYKLVAKQIKINPSCLKFPNWCPGWDFFSSIARTRLLL